MCGNIFKQFATDLLQKEAKIKDGSHLLELI
jgi:hypothetical protein